MHGWLVTKGKGKRNGPKETGGASQPRSFLSRDIFVKRCKAGDGLLERIMIAAPKPNLSSVHRAAESNPMDHSPIRQTFEFGKSIGTAGKSILNFMQLSSLVAKYCKIWKI